MIVGCYSMHLYCDNGNAEPDMTAPFAVSGHNYEDKGFGEFTGRTEGECKQQARARGWRFLRDDRVLCPRHAKS